MSPATSTDTRSTAAPRVEDSASARWADVSAAMAVFASDPAGGDAESTLAGVGACVRAESFIAWLRYRRSAELFDTVLAAMTDADDDGLDLFDAHTQTATRLAMTMAISQGWAENLLGQGLALRDRLPRVDECLRDGLISPADARLIISRTELLADDETAPVDAGIATAIRTKPGAWSTSRIRNLADRIVFRHDPDAVRRARERSLAGRTTWTNPTANGMATIGASMTAENARIAHDAVTALAATACEHDTRSRDARASDAFYSLLTGQAFTCECGHKDCTADIPAPGQLATDTAGRIVVHVVCDEATATDSADHPGFLAGHGVISADHARDIINRPDSTVRPVAGRAAPADSSTPELPLYQPTNPYRPSAALDLFIRIRDGYCTVPGCDRPAFDAEIDHVVEYDHDSPATGGPTHPDYLNAKCKFHHLLKTFSNWVDDQHTDADGHTRTTWATPERIIIDGPAENNADLFGGLVRYRWRTPETSAPTAPPTTPDRPRRVKTRTQRKHERRRAERARNRRSRERSPRQPGDPPF